MISSRNIADLLPPVQERCRNFLYACRKEGIELLVTCTYRDIESQKALYAQGRTKPGKIVTRANGGQSFHQYRVAFDTVPLVNGKPVWEDEHLWHRVGALSQSFGLEWAGTWKRFSEEPHFQFTGGLTITDFLNGKTLS